MATVVKTAESLSQAADVANVEFAFPGEDLWHDAGVPISVSLDWVRAVRFRDTSGL